MKRTLMMTAAFIFGGQMAFAAIDPQSLADSYVAEGYTYVEVKQGPTQTKLEGVKDGNYVEVVYDNETGSIISKDIQAADAEELAQTGVEIKTTDKDFEDITDEDGTDDAADTEDDNNNDQADTEDDNDDNASDDGDDGDNGDDGDSNDDGDDGGDDGDNSGGNDSSDGDGDCN